MKRTELACVAISDSSSNYSGKMGVYNTFAIVFMAQIRWISRGDFYFTLDLLLNANERTQWHLSKCTMDPLKREANEEEDRWWQEMVQRGRHLSSWPALLNPNSFSWFQYHFLLLTLWVCDQSNRPSNTEGDIKHLFSARACQMLLPWRCGNNSKWGLTQLKFYSFQFYLYGAKSQHTLPQGIVRKHNRSLAI